MDEAESRRRILQSVRKDRIDEEEEGGQEAEMSFFRSTGGGEALLSHTKAHQSIVFRNQGKRGIIQDNTKAQKRARMKIKKKRGTRTSETREKKGAIE